MEISLAPEQAFHFVPRFSVEVAQDRVEQKKTNLIAGTVGALLSRPKPEEIQMVGIENRLEPYWQISISARTRYDRNHSYQVTVSGPEVKGVTILGNEVTVEARAKEMPQFMLNGVEHCLEERRASHSFEGLNGGPVDLSKYQTFAKTLVVDLDTFAPEGVQVIPPQVRATAVVRQVMSEVIKPMKDAHIIHEERVDVEVIDLDFLPVYAFEYEWSGKGKRGVIEFDALTGEIRGSGRKLSTNFKGIVTRDLIFDVTADAVGALVPGGSIAVKLVKAVVDRDRR